MTFHQVYSRAYMHDKGCWQHLTFKENKGREMKDVARLLSGSLLMETLIYATGFLLFLK